MGVTISTCMQVEYELYESETEKALEITEWSLTEPEPATSFTFQELSASKYQFPFKTDDFADDSKFTLKCIDCHYTVHKVLENVKVMASMELDGDQFDSINVDGIFNEYNGIPWKCTLIGDLPIGKHNLKQIVYHATAMTRRILHVFIISSDTVILKARLMLMVPEECRGFMKHDTDQQAMRERESRLEDIIMASTSDSPFFAFYHPDHLSEAINASQMVRKPMASFIQAADSTCLAIRQYEPPEGNSKAVIIIICANNSFFMDPLAAEFAEKHQMTVLVAELRGFGHSGGKRGGQDVSHPDTIFTDCRSFIRHAKWNHSGIPIILIGHFLMCGLMLNYTRWTDAEPVDGLVFIAPNFGPSSRKLMRPEMQQRLTDSRLVKANKWALIAAKCTGGRLFGKRQGVSLQVDHNALSVNPQLVNHFSASLVMSWTCEGSAAKIGRLAVPTLVLLGDQDEFFDATALDGLVGDTKRHQNKIVSSAANLTIITNPQTAIEIANFITTHVKTKEAVIDVLKRVILRQPPNATNDDVIVEQLGQQARQAHNLGIRRFPTVFFEAHDGLKLAYTLFRPMTTETGPILVFLSPLDFSTLLLSCTQPPHNMIGIRFDPRASGKSGGRPGHVKDRHLIYKDIARMIRQARLSFPGRPVFLGGVVGGAALAVNFVNWVNTSKNGHDQPAGLFIINPLVSPCGQFGTEQSRNLFKREPLSWIKRLFGYKSKITLNLAYLQSDSYNAEFFAAHLLQDAIKDLNKAIKTCPTLLLLSSEFGLSRNNALFEQIHNNHSNHILSQITLTSGDLVHVLQEAVELGAPWMGRLSASMSPSPELPLSVLTCKSIDDINIIAFIGRGSFGTVWLGSIQQGQDETFNVAVKVLPKRMIKERALEESVKNEIKCMQLMRSSPHTVSLLAAFEDAKAVYIVMDYLIGGELLTVMMRRGRLQWTEALFYFAEICLAIQEMHTKGIVYRDLKPENILLDAVGHVRLVDFGFAEVLPDDKRSTRFCGSPYYVAPEMLTAGGHDHRVDWWAAGVVLFEMLAGRPPFPADSANKVYQQILFFSGGKSSIRRLLNSIDARPEVNSTMVDLITGLLQPDPDKRMGWEGVKRVLKGVVEWERVLMPPFVPTCTDKAGTNNFPQKSRQEGFEEWMAGMEVVEEYHLGIMNDTS